MFCSRVRTLKGLNLCEKLSNIHLGHFKPSQSVLAEENRLHILCCSTVENYEKIIKMQNRNIFKRTSVGAKREVEIKEASCSKQKKRAKYDLQSSCLNEETLLDNFSRKLQF